MVDSKKLSRSGQSQGSPQYERQHAKPLAHSITRRSTPTVDASTRERPPYISPAGCPCAIFCISCLATFSFTCINLSSWVKASARLYRQIVLCVWALEVVSCRVAWCIGIAQGGVPSHCVSLRVTCDCVSLRVVETRFVHGNLTTRTNGGKMFYACLNQCPRWNWKLCFLRTSLSCCQPRSKN